MAEKKPFLLRVDRSLLEAYQRWAADELRSMNGQLEFVLRDALRRAGRKIEDVPPSQDLGDSSDDA